MKLTSWVTNYETLVKRILAIRPKIATGRKKREKKDFALHNITFKFTIR